MIIKEFSKIDNKWNIIVKETDNISVIKKQYTFPDDIQKEINKILK